MDAQGKIAQLVGFVSEHQLQEFINFYCMNDIQVMVKQKEQNRKQRLIKAKEESEYEAAARKFLESTKTELKATFLFHGRHFDDDKDTRDVYQITLTRGDRVYRFNFGQSIKNSGTAKESFINDCPRSCPHYMTGTFACRAHARRRRAPTAYDVLACLTKYDPGTFKDFCAEYGYSDDSIKAQKVYFAVQEEFDGVRRLFGDKLDKLAAIQ